jgi:hypothetical protein
VEACPRPVDPSFMIQRLSLTPAVVDCAGIECYSRKPALDDMGPFLLGFNLAKLEEAPRPAENAQ